jgi:hypothetical protein
LKLLNGKFLNGIEGEKILVIAEARFRFFGCDSLGKLPKMMPI